MGEGLDVACTSRLGKDEGKGCQRWAGKLYSLDVIPKGGSLGLLKLCLPQSAFSSPGPSGHGQRFVFVFRILNMDAFPLLVC